MIFREDEVRHVLFSLVLHAAEHIRVPSNSVIPLLIIAHHVADHVASDDHHAAARVSQTSTSRTGSILAERDAHDGLVEVQELV